MRPPRTDEEPPIHARTARPQPGRANPVRPGRPQPVESGRLGREKARRRDRTLGPGLGEYRGAVVERQATGRTDTAPTDRRLTNALVGEKCREVLGVRAQVRQIHRLIFHFGLRPSEIGVKMSA